MGSIVMRASVLLTLSMRILVPECAVKVCPACQVRELLPQPDTRLLGVSTMEAFPDHPRMSCFVIFTPRFPFTAVWAS